MRQFRKFSLRNFICNLYRNFVYDDRETYANKADTDKSLNVLIKESGVQKLINSFLVCHIRNEQYQYTNELLYILEHGIDIFPYKQIKRCPVPDYGFDKVKKLPYVLHSGKRLYFSSRFTAKKASEMYVNYIERENLLGGGYTEKAPHQYQTDTFRVEQGDILVDVGCAEALLTLDVIDNIKCAYLIEGDPQWIPALKATFAPYQHKVKILNKYIGKSDSGENVTLESILREHEGSMTFVKMDIEGAEMQVLSNSKDYLASHTNLKIACCTYHNSSDYEKIDSYFRAIHYKVEVSEGVMLYNAYDDSVHPFFRHGLIRASSSEEKNI